MRSATFRLTINRLSALIALILLTYALIRFIALPSLSLNFSILGLLFQFQFDTRFFMLTLASILAAAGAEWLIRSHPGSRKRSKLGHLLIPGLAALGAGAIITRLALGWSLVVGFLLAGGFLFAVYAAEYIAHDPEDHRYLFAEFSLRILAFALFVSLLFVLQATGQRAAFSVPITLIASSAIAWRLIDLASVKPVHWIYPLVVGWIVAQLSWGLHYWPVPPGFIAVLLASLTYVLTEIMLAHVSKKLNLARSMEMAAVFCLSLILLIALS